MKPLIQFRDVSVTYGDGADATLALSPTNLSIEQGDFIALVGPSGCGKSTLLKLASELLAPSSGALEFCGVESVRVGMAFQSANLLPWLSIRKNVMMPLKIVPPYKAEYRKKRYNEYKDRVDQLLDQVGLLSFAEKQPWQLSGGMMQRANLCRALVHEPDLLLLDEPFGALDQFTREELWGTLQDLWLSKKPTVMLVTHDLREAAYLATRICVMSPRPGRILEDRSVSFPRPRSLQTTFQPEFSSLVQELHALISVPKKQTQEFAR
ncbi:ABC transporter ATP-binding protein [Pelagicoccus albus]|uniref:ABC transporter ATP-binding protein n=1 Tax=Pelagicoccus albus TaxID=415222 RepID=A0A7X1BBE2_9BACT|nr:ABC transporter ATP-binding protein [Pelagicoccus albus]MBC2607933.1 ABC transporter ATP-binding protein [Pelagicoccus albus]